MTRRTIVDQMLHEEDMKFIKAVNPDYPMHAKIFKTLEIREATEYAKEGNLAIHLHKIVFPNSPKCFRDAVARGEYIAHVFCQDVMSLELLGRMHGIKRVKIDRRNSPRQHADFCGEPLRKLCEYYDLDISEIME
jgi:hypothetical protein